MLFSIASLNKFISRMRYMQVGDSQLKIYKWKTNLFCCQLRSGDFRSLLVANVVEQDVLQLIFWRASFFHCCVMWYLGKHLDLVTFFLVGWHKMYHEHVRFVLFSDYFFSRFSLILLWLLALEILSATSTQKSWIALHIQSVTLLMQCGYFF